MPGVEHVGPYSRPKAFAKLDGRSQAAKYLKATRAELTAHLGGKLTAPQRMLVERAAKLALQVELMDSRMTVAGAMTDHDSRTYLAWTNSLRLIMRELGLEKSQDVPGNRLQQHLARKAA